MARRFDGAYNARILVARVHACLCAVLALAGCGGEEASLSLRLLYPVPEDGEPPLREWLGDGCGNEVVLGQCVALKLSACACTDPALPCPPDESTCNSVFSAPDDAERGHLASLQGGTFDLPTNTANRDDLFLQVAMYGDGRLLATGEARNVAFPDSRRVGLTLFPVGGGTACPEPGGGSVESLRKRTFHSATLLPNGRVLIAGGVTGPVIKTAPDGNALGNADSVQVLDPRTGGVENVEVDNQAPGEAGGSLFRAFHQAVYLGTDPEGRFVVRVVGGIRAQGTKNSVLLSRTRDGMPLQLLFSGAASDDDAEPAPPVDLHYDAAAKLVTVTDAGTDRAEYPTTSFGGFAVLTDPNARPGVVTGGYYFGGGLGPWTEDEELGDDIPPTVDNGFLMSPTGGTTNATPHELLVGRVGGTALGIGTDEVLYWGGNVWSVDGSADAVADIAAEMAEIVRPTGGAAGDFVTVTGVPVVSTAFHAAAVAAVDGDVYRIVVAGGYQVGPLEAVSAALFSTVPLYLVSYDKSSQTADVTEVECGGPCEDAFGDVAYATATLVAPGRVLIVGGNFRYGSVSYGARAVAGVVTVTGETAVYEPVELGAARYGHTATRLLDGSVLILGGVTLDCSPGQDDNGDCAEFGDITPLDNYEIYNEGLAFGTERDCEEAQ